MSNVAPFDWSQLQNPPQAIPEQPKAFDWSQLGIKSKNKPMELEINKINKKEEKPESFEKMLEKALREAAKAGLSKAIGGAGQYATGNKSVRNIGSKVGLGAIPAAEEIPQGTLEGLQRAYAGLTGQPAPSQAPVSDEYGAGAGRQIGHVLGQGIPAAGVGAITGGLGSAAGLSPLLSSMLAGSSGIAATTPGGFKERLPEAALGAAIPLGAHTLKAIAKGLMNTGQNFKNMVAPSALNKEVNRSLIEQEKAKNYEQWVQQQLSNQGLPTNPEKIAYDINKQKEALQQAFLQHRNIPEENLSNRLMPPTGEELVPQAQEHAKSITQKISEIIPEGEAHGEKIYERIVPRIEGVRNAEGKKVGGLKQEIGSLYDKVESNLENKNIVLDNTARVQKLNADLVRIISKGGYKTPEQKKLASEIFALSEQKQIPASKYVSSFRTIKKLANRARSDAFKIGNSTEEKDALLSKADDLDVKADEMYQVLEKNELGDDMDLLRQANHRWKTEIVPLYKNSFYQTMKKSGRAPSGNILEKLSGFQEGQDIINRMIKQDPELQRLITGHHFSAKPEKIHLPNELAERYIPQSMKTVIESQRRALENVKLAEKLAKKYETTHKTAQESVKESIADQLKRKKLEKEIAESKIKIAELSRRESELKNAAKKVKSSSEEHEKIMNQRDEAVRKRKKLSQAIVKHGTRLGAAGAGIAIYRNR